MKNLKPASCPNCKTNQKVLLKLSGKFNLYFCNLCQNGFLYPVPADLAKYYPLQHWQFPGLLTKFREKFHNLLQVRRKKWITGYISKGAILDVGAGEGIFGKTLGAIFQVTNLEAPFAEVNNKEVTRVDFLKWRSNKKFDGIVFLESLEHVPSPQKYLQKAQGMLKKKGYIFIECPRYDSFESKLFQEKWHHLDLPRHTSHLTRKGISILAVRNNLKIKNQTGMLAYELSPYCFINSLMLALKIKPLNLKEKSFSNLASILIALTLFPLGAIIETIFHLIDQDPIQLSVLQKK